MRTSRFTDEQMAAILREADPTSVAEAAKKKNQVNEQTIYAGRNHLGAMSPSDVRVAGDNYLDRSATTILTG